MSDHDVDVDAEAILSLANGLRDDATALDSVSGSLPAADAGVMSPVVETAVGDLLSLVGLLGAALLSMADTTEDSALGYHRQEERTQEDLARLLLPGDATQADVAESVERTQRAQELDLARLLMPYDPEGAEQAVLDSPSRWDEAEERQEQRQHDGGDSSGEPHRQGPPGPE